jgi:enoyl-CoA hydratase/carnithine racemase
MSVGELIRTVRRDIVLLTLNRPEQRNALTPELIDRLLDELERLDADETVRAIVLGGAGEAFCAGYDINFLESPGTADAGVERDHVETLCSRLRAMRVPTIAKVNGVASGGGCDLAVSCDLRFAADSARFAMPPARLGVLYSHEGIARLTALVGPAVAKELLFAGELVDAERALEIGLVNRVYPARRLDEETQGFAETVAVNAPLSVAGSKLIVNLVADGAPLPDEAAATIEEVGLRVWTSQDAVEGPTAYRERRPPRFRGT